ncbi:MAG: hypothetical protein ABIA92_00310 [Patescibacteria group bacterium]
MNTFPISNWQRKKTACMALVLALSTILFVPVAVAANDGGGLGDASAITGIDDAGGDSESIKDTITNIVLEALTFVALIATIVIIIGGVYLVAGAGSDSSREKAKNIIIYTIVGLLVIILAGAIVNFIKDAAS